MASPIRRTAHRIDSADRALTRRVAALPRSRADAVLKAASVAANHSLLWFAVAALLAGKRGTSRKAAARALVAIGGASTLSNAVLKPLLPRRRPAADELPAHRILPDAPQSSSFPSGHAASAAAFATAVAMESPRLGLVVAPLAATVAYSRVHNGVHWGTDVLAGAAIGTGVALATRRWWPVREQDEARARPLDTAPELPDGDGLVIISNQRSGNPDVDPADDLEKALPQAVVVRAEPELDLDAQLDAAVAERDGWVRAIGVAGGDGSVAAAAAVAGRRGLPLVVVPTGTLNHFARDVGVYDLQEAVDSTSAGQAVAVSLGVVDVHSTVNGHEDIHTRAFLNTASVGGYPDLVRLRERWQPRLGKWPAFAVALVAVLRRAQPLAMTIDGRATHAWLVFVGNGPYHPRGMLPAWRPSLDSRLLDVRWLSADLRFARTRAVAALLLGALGHSRVYHQRSTAHVEITLPTPSRLATDGEVIGSGTRFTFRVADEPIAVYRRDETLWTGRDRPFHRV